MITIKNLATEISKPQYNGKTDAEILALLPQVESKVGRIQDDNKLDLLTLVVTNAIDDRLEAAKAAESVKLTEAGIPAEQHETYRKLAASLFKILKPEIILADLFRINLALAEVKGSFDGAVFYGLLTSEENTKLIELATYSVNDEFTDVQESDIAQARLIGTQGSAKTNYQGDADWHVRLANEKVIVFVNVTNPVPIDTVVTIEKFGCSEHRINTDEANFLRSTRTLTVHIKAGESGGDVELTMPSARWLKFEASANVLIGHYELDIQKA